MSTLHSFQCPLITNLQVVSSIFVHVILHICLSQYVLMLFLQETVEKWPMALHWYSDNISLTVRTGYCKEKPSETFQP